MCFMYYLKIISKLNTGVKIQLSFSGHSIVIQWSFIVIYRYLEYGKNGVGERQAF